MIIVLAGNAMKLQLCGTRVHPLFENFFLQKYFPRQRGTMYTPLFDELNIHVMMEDLWLTWVWPAKI